MTLEIHPSGSLGVHSRYCLIVHSIPAAVERWQSTLFCHAAVKLLFSHFKSLQEVVRRRVNTFSRNLWFMLTYLSSSNQGAGAPPILLCHLHPPVDAPWGIFQTMGCDKVYVGLDSESRVNMSPEKQQHLSCIPPHFLYLLSSVPSDQMAAELL